MRPSSAAQQRLFGLTNSLLVLGLLAALLIPQVNVHDLHLEPSRPAVTDR